MGALDKTTVGETTAGENLAKAALLITAVSFFNKFLGLLRESALAAYFGATYESDAYKLAVSIPGILLSILSVSIATTFIPVYSEWVKTKSREQVGYFTNNVFNIVALLSIVLTGLGFAISPYIVGILARGFDTGAYLLTLKLTQITMASIVFTALYNLSSGFVQANKRFFTPVFAWTVCDLLVFGALILFHGRGIEAVTVVTTFAMIGMLLVQIPAVVRSGYSFRPVVDFREEGVKKIARLIIPVTISSLFNQLYVFIDRMLASGLDEGSISALDYANRINSLVYNIFIVSIITVVFPNLSFQAGETAKFKKTLVKAIRVICLMAFPGMALLFVLRAPIVRILFERGAFDARDTGMTAAALGCYALSIIGVGLREILNRAFYALQDTKAPVVNGILVIAVNIAMSLVFVRFWGIGGLAAAVSLSALISGLLLWAGLRRKMGPMEGRKLLASVAGMLFSAVAAGAAAYLCSRLLDTALPGEALAVQAVRLAACGGAGCAVYVGLLHIMKIEELRIVTGMAKSHAAKLAGRLGRISASGDIE